MPSEKKDEEHEKAKKNKKSAKGQGDSAPSVVQEDQKTKKKKPKEGFSVLGSLAKFMSREKVPSPLPAPSEPLNEIKTESVSTVQNEILKPEYTTVSSQTSNLSVRSSSTLSAVSNAVDALKEVRRRVVLLSSKNSRNETHGTHPPEIVITQNDLGSHNPNLLLQNKTVQDSRSRNRVNFTLTPLYYEEIRNNDDDNDVVDSVTVLYRSAPNQSTDTFYFDLPPTKNIDIQNKTDLGTKGTQTLNDALPAGEDPLDSENSWVRELLENHDDKCLKCELFKVIFLHDKGETLVNNKELLEMFKRHMNSHQLKAPRDLNKPYKWPGKIAETDNFEQTKFNPMGDPVVRKSSAKTALNNDDENKFRDEGATVTAKNEGTSQQSRHLNADGAKGKTDIETKWGSLNTKEPKRDTFRDGHPRDVSFYMRLLRNLLATETGNGLEEVIMRRKHCDTNGHNDCDSRYCQDDGYCHSENAGHDETGKSVKEDENDKCPAGNKNGRCFPERYKYVPLCNLINPKCENADGDRCSCDEYECNYKCVGANCSSPCDNPGQHDDLSGMESQLKWFIKGMLAAIKVKGHHGVKSTGSNKRENESVLNLKDEGKLEKTLTPESKAGTENGQLDPTSKDDTLKAAQDNDNLEISPTLKKAIMLNYLNESTKAIDAATEKQLFLPPTEKIESLDTTDPKKSLIDIVSTMEKEPAAETQASDPTVEDNAKEKGPRREDSILEEIVFLILKELVKNLGNGGEGGIGPESRLDKQDMKKSEQQANIDCNCSPLYGANKPTLNCCVPDGKSDGIEAQPHKNFNLNDPKVQELIQDILSVIFINGNSKAGGSETPADSISYQGSSFDKIVQQICSILKGTTTDTATPNEPIKTPKSTTPNKIGTSGGQTTYSYFCDSDNAFCIGNQFCCCNRSLNQRDPGCCNEKQSGDYNCCQLPLQEAFKHSHPGCYRSVANRQKCVTNCKRESVQQQHRQRQTNCSRPSTNTATRSTTGNAFCGRNLNATTARHRRDACEAFTYVVPQCNMYWESL